MCLHLVQDKVNAGCCVWPLRCHANPNSTRGMCGYCVNMATNLRIDEGLLLKAKRVGGFKTKRYTVNSALAEYVEKREQQKILSLFGGVDMASDFNHKDLRAKLGGEGAIEGHHAER